MTEISAWASKKIKIRARLPTIYKLIFVRMCVWPIHTEKFSDPFQLLELLVISLVLFHIKVGSDDDFACLFRFYKYLRLYLLLFNRQFKHNILIYLMWYGAWLTIPTAYIKGRFSLVTPVLFLYPSYHNLSLPITNFSIYLYLYLFISLPGRRHRHLVTPQAGSTSEDNTQIFVMNNYFGIGFLLISWVPDDHNLK